MLLLVLAFFSGILTVLAPCVLPLLPIILWVSAEQSKKYQALILIVSLGVSIFAFSILLKTTTLLIDVPASFWKLVSGGIILVLWVVTLFPALWKTLATKLGFSDKSNSLLAKGSQKQGNTKYILMGAAMGPVFSSCSPTYSLILAIILPASYAFWLLALLSYILGLSLILWCIALLGQRFVSKLKWISNPKGIFQKVLGVLFILIGIFIITGLDKKLAIKILDTGFLNTTNFEQKFIDKVNFDNFEDDSQKPQPERSENIPGIAPVSSQTGSLEIPISGTPETNTSLSLQQDTLIPEKKSETSPQSEASVCSAGICKKEEENFLQEIETLFQDIQEPGWDTALENQKVAIEKNTGYPAPDLTGLTNWINSDGFSSLQELRGQVVIIDFWTLGCINCINTLEHTEGLYKTYKDKGLLILGLHAPEFAYEQKLTAVQETVKKYGLTFPVAQDNDFSTWKAYSNRYWPAFYLIDKKWQVRYTYYGEGKYEEKEKAILELLAE
jgi:cytochrome c-type biogenesis protein